jgi:alpha-beta hydrolase superfamily lysophospholipase
MPYPEGPQAPGEWRETFFNSKDGLRLFAAARVVPSPKGVVVLVHGYADHCLRYRHVIGALAIAGYSTYAFDYRGHGQAGGRRGYVAHFADYLADLTVFMDRVRAENPSVPLFILGHSHGCLVSGMLLTEQNAPRDVAGVVFSAPYYRLRIKPSVFQLFQAKVVGAVLPFLPVKNPLTVDMLTRDLEFQKASDEDPLRHHVITPRWFTESNAAQETLLARAGDFKYPLLVMTGEVDPVADPSGAQQFADAAGSRDKKLVRYPNMLHEIFNEVERDKPISEMVRWLDARVPAKAVSA